MTFPAVFVKASTLLQPAVAEPQKLEPLKLGLPVPASTMQTPPAPDPLAQPGPFLFPPPPEVQKTKRRKIQEVLEISDDEGEGPAKKMSVRPQQPAKIKREKAIRTQNDVVAKVEQDAIKPFFYCNGPIYKIGFGKFVHAEKVNNEPRFVFAEWSVGAGVGWSMNAQRTVSLSVEQFFRLSAMVLQGRTDLDQQIDKVRKKPWDATI